MLCKRNKIICTRHFIYNVGLNTFLGQISIYFNINFAFGKFEESKMQLGKVIVMWIISTEN